MQGLQVVEKDTGKVVLLSSLAPVSPGSSKTTPVHYANDLTIASDGGIYFTDSTDIPPALNAAGFYDTMASYLLTMIQVAPESLTENLWTQFSSA